MVVVAGEPSLGRIIVFCLNSGKYKRVVGAIVSMLLPSLHPLVLIPNAACRYCEKPSSDVHTLQFLFID